MPNIATATHHTYARFTVAGVTQGVGTDEAYRSGVQHEAALLDDATLSETWVEDVARGAQIMLRVGSRDDLGEELLDESFDPLLTEAGDPLLEEFGPYAALTLGAVDGLELTVESVTVVTYDDNTTAEFARSQKLTCIGRERNAGSVTLRLVDIEDKRLNALYPPRLYTTADFPALLTSDAGRAVPIIFGIALKIPGVLISSATPYRYVLAEHTNASEPAVLTVYRGKSDSDARVVPGSEYTTGLATTPFPHLWVEFTQEQRDFDGSLFRISADLRANGEDDALVTDAIWPVAFSAGITLGDPISAESYATTGVRFVSCDFGRAGQRTVRAILEDLLWVLGATLIRNNSAGGYAVIVDSNSASVATLDEDAGDEIEVLSLSEPAKPLSVGIAYRVSPRDPAALQHSLTRDIPGGVLAAERPRELRYVRSHSVADHCLSYRAARASLSAVLRARVYRLSLAVKDVITVTSAAYGVSSSQWRIRDLKHIVGGLEIEATPYDASLNTYVAGTLPADAVNDYQPDYSNTPPLAPTGFRITATATALQGDGTLIARVTADAIPPVVNWESFWIAAIHNTTSEITLGRADSVGGGRYGLTLTGLRPGEVYQLKAYAVNGFGVQGVVLGTFDATAIGGGATDTTFTTAGYATLPADVSSITAAQGTGKLINATWAAVTTANLREYVLERKVGAGAYSEVWRGQARSYVDRDVAYGSTYTYRVKARDTYGNLSANYATSSGVTLNTGTVLGGSSGNDIGGDTVATSNRTAVTGVSYTYTSTDVLEMKTQDGTHFKSISHSLGKTPVVGGAVYSGIVEISVHAANPTSSVIDVCAKGSAKNLTEDSTTNFSAGYVEAELEAHVHTLDYNVVADGESATVYVW